ncbi:hypothetical protein SAMN02745671_00997 [Anaerovibrio lipolyticus DSM 3074]|uniref:Uncharacterized protein n=1 Tax=Anaerovibrio lipolyticus DSM 3074 TaxID=1120997 RepID=A0A1M6C5B8_9FIRM|nr:hypothetical protein SAMN02745671_00997 [Anaerovibrio lipolyticus DSM 3074]
MDEAELISRIGEFTIVLSDGTEIKVVLEPTSTTPESPKD